MKSYISREDAIDAICKNCNYMCEGICTDYENLMALPPADVRENVCGEWINTDVFERGDKLGYMCSECEIGGYEKTPYCPHCGAKMKVETEGEQRGANETN